MNNVLKNQTKGISNLFELESISTNINNLNNQIEMILNDFSMDSFERKMRIRELTEEKTFFTGMLSKGISIDKPSFAEEIKSSIISFLKQNGFDTKEFEEKMTNLRFYITNERLASGGLLATYSNKVMIDYSLVNFDENGNFLDFKEDKKEFIRYTLTHEFLHVCSTNTKESFKDDALSEGYTDLLAHVISKNNNDKSNRYDYFVKICALFANLVGVKGTLEDYFYNLGTMPNLKDLFKTCGLEEKDFLEFYQELNNVMNLQTQTNQSIINEKINLINKIKEYIVIPYLKTNGENKENNITLFNNLFKEFNINCSLDEIKTNQI